MSQTIRRLLERHLFALDDGFDTVWENVASQPKVPYQAVFLQPTSANTATISDQPLSEERGYFQITLYYPKNSGTAEISQKADEIRRHFYAFTQTQDGTQLIIQQPPLLGGLVLVNDLIAMPITVYYTAYQLSD